MRPGVHGRVRLMSTQLAPVAADTTSAATRRYRTWTTTADRLLIALVAEGKTRRQISRHFGVSEMAVVRRSQRVYRRLGAINAPHAVLIAVRAGLIPATDRPSEAFVVAPNGVVCEARR